MNRLGSLPDPSPDPPGGDDDDDQEGEVRMRHGAEKKRYYGCSHEGCTNIAVKGGVCIRHGAKVKRCSHEGCTNNAVNKGGVCWRHGAKRTLCSHEGCTNTAQNNGVCQRHGAVVKRCSHEGCTNQVQKGGLCFRHGAVVKRCSHEGCTNYVQLGGVYIRHSAKRTLCSHAGCTNYPKRAGVCYRHGAKRTICSHAGCISIVQQGGVCNRHGAKSLIATPGEVDPLPRPAERDQAATGGSIVGRGGEIGGPRGARARDTSKKSPTGVALRALAILERNSDDEDDDNDDVDDEDEDEDDSEYTYETVDDDEDGSRRSSEVNYRFEDNRDERPRHPYIASYVCDVCGVARFPTMEEAEEHERACLAAVVDVDGKAGGTSPTNPRALPPEEDDSSVACATASPLGGRARSLGADVRGVGCSPTKGGAVEEHGRTCLAAVDVEVEVEVEDEDEVEVMVRPRRRPTSPVPPVLLHPRPQHRPFVDVIIIDDEDDDNDDENSESKVDNRRPRRRRRFGEGGKSREGGGLLLPSAAPQTTIGDDGTASLGAMRLDDRNVGAANWDVVAREDEEGGGRPPAESTCGRATAKEGGSAKLPWTERPPRRALYPVGCPVWFNMRRSIPCSRYLTADTGIVRSVAFDPRTHTAMYEVEGGPSTGGIGTGKYHGVIAEGEIAFAICCPVLVRMADDDGSSEMEGEIINVKPSNRYRGGTTTLYSVLIPTAEKGGVFIEEDVLPGRIRYRYSLQALQSRIRDVTLSSNRKRKAVGIRSNGRHEPICNKMPLSVEVKRRFSIALDCFDGCHYNEDDVSMSDEMDQRDENHNMSHTACISSISTTSSERIGGLLTKEATMMD